MKKTQTIGLEENFSYIETPYEAAARYLDRAIGEVSKAVALGCMADEPELRQTLFCIGADLGEKRALILERGKTDTRIRFGKLEAK